MTELTRNIKRRLRDHNMTQKDLGNKVGLSQPMIHRLFAGKVKKTRHTVIWDFTGFICADDSKYAQVRVWCVRTHYAIAETCLNDRVVYLNLQLDHCQL